MSGPTNGGRAEAYAALRNSEELHRAVLGNISDAVFLTDDVGQFTFICPNVDVIFGFVPDEVQAMGNISRLLGERLFELERLVSDGEIQNIERDVLSKSGQPRTVLVHTKRVSIRNGTILYTCRDVTERKAAEVRARLAQAELAHASRLAVTGELIGSIVHEVTQPLSAISTTASTGLKLLENLGGTDLGALSDLLEEIRDQGRLAADVVDRLRALVRKQPLKLERLDANVVVRELERLLDGQARIRQVTLSAELANSALMVMADRVSLQHVFLNLVLNGMDAVSQSRSARLITLRSRQVADGVEVSVADTGPGISAETASRVFDPFFTTKRDGVGLGLTIARSLIQAHGGDISVSNGADGGALFRVTLPAAVATEG